MKISRRIKELKDKINQLKEEIDNLKLEEDLSYYYDPESDEDFLRIAIDVYGSGVRDNSRAELIELGKEYHETGEA